MTASKRLPAFVAVSSAIACLSVATGSSSWKKLLCDVARLTLADDGSKLVCYLRLLSSEHGACSSEGTTSQQALHEDPCSGLNLLASNPAPHGLSLNLLALSSIVELVRTGARVIRPLEAVGLRRQHSSGSVDQRVASATHSASGASVTERVVSELRHATCCRVAACAKWLRCCQHPEGLRWLQVASSTERQRLALSVMSGSIRATRWHAWPGAEPYLKAKQD